MGSVFISGGSSSSRRALRYNYPNSLLGAQWRNKFVVVIVVLSWCPSTTATGRPTTAQSAALIFSTRRPHVYVRPKPKQSAFAGGFLSMEAGTGTGIEKTGTRPQTIPSCQELAQRALTLQRTLGRCVFIAIAGGPGSGKTTVAEAVASAINNHDATGQEDVAVVLPMDGYHISKANLKIMARDNKGTTYEALMARRGAPWTFDHEQLIQDLTKATILLQEEPDTNDGKTRLKQEFEFPTYSRDISDPVPGGVCLKPSHHTICICEGNYLLAFEDDHWKPLESLWDEGWLVVAPTFSVQLERLIHRHLLTWTDEKTKLWGPGREGGALARAQANDLKNAEWISQTSTQHATLIIQNP
eukprot:scaffold12632_cov52-Attheya_sp.AAC.3